jgi:hypothetical protein
MDRMKKQNKSVVATAGNVSRSLRSGRLISAFPYFERSLKIMKNFLTLIFVISCSSCATYLRGDLESKNLAKEGVKINFSKQTGSKKYGTANTINSKYDVEVDYRTGGIGETPATYLTLFTLGLIPSYSTNKFDVEYVIRRGGRIVDSGQLDSRFHTFYGWFAILLADGDNNPSEDLMNFHEGDSIRNQMEKTLDDRFSRYLAKQLKYLREQAAPCNHYHPPCFDDFQ